MKDYSSFNRDLQKIYESNLHHDTIQVQYLILPHTTKCVAGDMNQNSFMKLKTEVYETKAVYTSLLPADVL